MRELVIYLRPYPRHVKHKFGLSHHLLLISNTAVFEEKGKYFNKMIGQIFINDKYHYKELKKYYGLSLYKVMAEYKGKNINVSPHHRLSREELIPIVQQCETLMFT